MATPLTKTSAIQRFLKFSTSPVAKWYTPEMEVQVMVAKDNGVKYTGEYKSKQWKGFQDPDNKRDIWKHIRIPINANTNPHFVNSPMMFSLEKHAEGIGMTGWNWKQKKSMWVGYDFDSIVNHKIGINEEEMERVKAELSAIPWVEVITSTSGSGIHAYVHFTEGFPTENHNEHAAVARSVLTLMSAECGYNFKSNVDCVGSILWCWHRKQEGTNGLQMYKKAESNLPVEAIPKNWKSHLSVVSRKSAQIILNGDIKELSATTKTSNIDEKHKMILKWLSKNAKRNFWYDTDHNMVVGHTQDFLACHESLALQGLFSTLSSGEDPKQNCFGFLRPDGIIQLRRYGKYCEEDASWTVDVNGWVKIDFNSPPSFSQSCGYYGGMLNAKNNFVYESHENFSATDAVTQSLASLGIEISFSDQLRNRSCIIAWNRTKNNISVEVTREKDDMRERGWINEGKTWLKVFPFTEDSADEGNKDINVDNIIRSTQKNGQDYGWYINVNEEWVQHGVQSVDSVMATKMPELKASERQKVKGECILNPYAITDEPFAPEYPGGRLWNKAGAQLAYSPTKGIHPTWDAILAHVGYSLKPAVTNSKWCEDNGIEDGHDYLRHWVGYMFQQPEQPLPYLFVFGGQNTGKSSLHEALSILFKEGKGYHRAEEALQGSFNGSLEGTILAVIEEINFNKSRKIYDRIKDLVTAKDIAIRAMYKDVYMAKNYCKFIQVSNYKNACPVFEGDTRVVVIEVDEIETEIDKHILFKRLHDEAPSFLHTMLNMVLPEKTGRLALPVLETEAKTDLQEQNLTALEEYIKEQCYLVDGESIPLEEFKVAFHDWLSLSGRDIEISKWGKHKIGGNLPNWGHLCKGYNYVDSKTRPVSIGNISMMPKKGKPKHVYVKRSGGYIKRMEVGNG